MSPSLIGRIQTRLVLLATVGLAWTIVIVPFLPKGGATLTTVYGTTLVALIMVGLAGVGWEFLYHAIQQYRWEKDWPTLFGLLVGIPEGILAFVLVGSVVDDGPNLLTFTLHFASTWILLWLTAIGPLRMVLLRWRYQGGKIF